MDKKFFKDVPPDIKSKYQTALTAKDIEYGIMLLKGILVKEPAFWEAREQLRKLERQKTASLGFVAKLTSGFKISGIVTKGKTQLAMKKPMEALKQAEEALSLSLASLQGLNLMAQAGRDLNARFISIEALEIATEYFPKNVVVLDWLAEEYAADKQGRKSLVTRQKIAALKPGDLDAQQKVRAAAALATMDDNKWEDKTGGDEQYRKLLKSQDDAKKLEQQDKIVRNVDDVRDLIGDLEKQMAAGKGTLETKRKLGDLYQKAEQHDKAIQYFNLVVQEMGVMDPFIDRAIEKSTVSNYEKSIEQWRQYANDPTKKAEADSNIATITGQMMNFKLTRALERVNSYPNDLQLRYELAVIYFDLEQYENALHQFQLSQKNPQRRLSSIVYLGQCFHQMKQYDIAIEEFNKAIGEMIPMDKQKMDAMYFLAQTYEELGSNDKALDNYKQIYRANIKFRDVADRINKMTGKT